MKIKNTMIVRAGALYDLNGVTCRLTKKLNNGTLLMTVHGRFNTFANPSELKKIDTKRVKNYFKK